MFQTLNSLIRQNRKFALTLLLLTSAVLVACDRNVTSSSITGSSSSTGSSSTSTSVSSSAEEFNGSEVPNWNLENPVISTSSSVGLDIGLDRSYFGRREGDYTLYIGSKTFAGTTDMNRGYRNYVIINQKTATEHFRWQLDPGASFVTWALTANNYNAYWFDERFTFEDNTMYATMRLTPQAEFNVTESLVGGDYAPFITYINDNFSTKYPIANSRLNRQYNIAFKVDMTTKAVTVLGAGEAWEYEVREMFAEEGFIYTTLDARKGTNQANPFEAFLPLPTEVPTLSPNNARYTILYKLDIEDLSIVSSHVISATADVYSYLNNFRRGFDIVSFDKNGHIFFNFNFNFNVQNREGIATTINNFNTSALSSTQLDALKADQIPVIQNFYDLIKEEITIDNFYFNMSISGGFNLSTNQIENMLVGSNTYQSNQQGEAYEGNRFQQYFEYDNEAYIIEVNRILVRDNNQMSFNFFTMPSIYSTSKVYRLNLETQQKTLLLDFDNNGVMLTGIYRHTGGFYVTGNYNNSSEFTTGLGKTEAFLRSYNASFTKIGEVVLSGSEHDISQGIILDNTNQPVWIVYSNSTDGDFATVGASNTTGSSLLYFVRFN